MKRFIIISLIAVAITTIVVFSFCIGRPKVVIANNQAKLRYIYNDVNISINLNEDESKAIKKVFNKKFLCADSLSCGFSENISICFSDSVFCIACDNCPIIKYNNKYFKISNEERNLLNDIFEKYGGYFPCV